MFAPACGRKPLSTCFKSFGFMRIAYLKCFSGISGDMFLGALLDAGVPPEVLTRTVAALGVDARLEISRVDRSGISATKVDVIAAGEKELPREEFWQEAYSNQQSALSQAKSSLGHGQEHAHGHSQTPPRAAVPHELGHAHQHSHEHSHDHGHQHEHGSKHSHRGLKEIRQIINQAAISQSAKDRAIKIF